ncbi:MAG: hypothetical protein K6F33_08285 [Bacteroidales bacterium]|nr:hypothetical protein [Bacteroidales bacterium]
MTKLTKLIIIGAAAALVVGALLWWMLSSGGKQVTIYPLKESIIPMRLKVIARSDGSPQIAVKFFDADGKAVGRCELPYTGGGIMLNILEVDIEGSHFYFPDEITQLASPDTLKLPLQQFYVKDGYPMIYDSQIAEQTLKEEIASLYGYITNGNNKKIERTYGTIRQTTVTLGEPMERVNYSLTAKAQGGVFFAN